MKNNRRGFSEILIILIGITVVGIAGFVAYQNSKIEINHPLTTMVPISNPTDSWETYTDKSGSFSFKYPKDWNINFNTGAKNIKLIGTDETITKDEYLRGKDYNPGYETYERYGEISETTIGNKKAFTQTKGRDDFGVEIVSVIEVAPDKGLFVNLSYNAGNDSLLRKEYEAEAKQILHTFVFTK